MSVCCCFSFEHRSAQIAISKVESKGTPACAIMPGYQRPHSKPAPAKIIALPAVLADETSIDGTLKVTDK